MRGVCGCGKIWIAPGTSQTFGADGVADNARGAEISRQRRTMRLSMSGVKALYHGVVTRVSISKKRKEV